MRITSIVTLNSHESNSFNYCYSAHFYYFPRYLILKTALCQPHVSGFLTLSRWMDFGESVKALNICAIFCGYGHTERESKTFIRISTAKGKVFPHWIGVKKNPDLKVTQSERNSERFHRLYHEKYLPNPSQTYIPFPRLHCHSVFIIFRAGERSLVKVRHSPLFLQFVIFERSQDQIFGSLCQSSTTWTCFY